MMIYHWKGSASGICDGAAALVIAGESAVRSEGLKPLVRMVAWHRVGCEPSIMGIGPVEAIRGVLKASGLTLGQIDLVEINEAFAGQYLSCEKELDLDRSKTNVNGGAIALGHPLGASGARMYVPLSPVTIPGAYSMPISLLQLDASSARAEPDGQEVWYRSRLYRWRSRHRCPPRECYLKVITCRLLVTSPIGLIYSH
jgi:hypothetical protein